MARSGNVARHPPRRRGSGGGSHRGRYANAGTELLLPLAVEVGGVGIFDTDLERKRTRFSPELCTILGLPVGAEMSYAEAWQLIDERDRHAIQARVNAARTLADRGKWNGLCRVLRADGNLRWVSICGRRIYRETTGGLLPVRSIGTVVDVTDLKEAEAALRESELRLRLALDAAQMGTFEADIEASAARIDAQEARLLGLPEGTQTVSVEDMRKRIHLEDLKASDEKQARMTQQREAYHHEFRLVMPDGSERWISAHADVRSGRIFGVNFDVTQSKRAETAVREREARLRMATEAAALGVFEWDPVKDCTTWENDRIYRIFGRARAEGPLNKQQFVADYLHPSDARGYEAAVAQAMRTVRLHVVCRIRRKNGALRWLQIDGKVERASASAPKRLIGVVADVTARKRMEDAEERLPGRVLYAQEEERRSIAQELHDSTVQHLVAASLLLTTLKARSTIQDQSLWDDLDQVLGQAMKELRTFSYLMHPPTLKAVGLSTSLQRYAEGFAERSGLPVRLRLNIARKNLPLGVQRSIFRIVQEALSNAYRHASASAVFVQLRQIGGRLHIIITDNGIGLDAIQQRLGTCIRGIEMRVKRVGGRLRLSRPLGGGTRLHAVLPIDAQSQ